MSGVPTISGMSQLPKPPINIGMTKKKNHDQPMTGNNDIVPMAVHGRVSLSV